MLMPSPRNHADHFNLLARFTSSSEAETVSLLSLTGRDSVPFLPGGTVTAGGLSGSPAFLSPLPRKGKSAWLTTKHEITPAQSRQCPASPRSATTGPTPRTICARPATSSCPHSIGFAVHRSSTVCPTRNSPTPIISYSSVSRQSGWLRKSPRSPGIWPSTSEYTVARRSGLTAGKTAPHSPDMGTMSSCGQRKPVSGNRSGGPGLSCWYGSQGSQRRQSPSRYGVWPPPSPQERPFSPSNDPPNHPFCDEEAPGFGRNPNCIEDLT